MLEQVNSNNQFRQDEFTFGDKILVCPVIEQGAISRIVYLPKGKWYNYWTHEVLLGGLEHKIEASLEYMPMFVRAGSVIPEYPVMQYVGEKPIEEVLLNVYYADYEVNSYFYEDHGDTFAYEQGIYSEKKFTLKGEQLSMSIDQLVDGLYTSNYELYSHSIAGLPFEVKRIMIDERDITDYHMDERQCLRFKSNKNFSNIKILGA
jgi:alpha-glucosidase